jgi:hypothetical protein
MADDDQLLAPADAPADGELERVDDGGPDPTGRDRGHPERGDLAGVQRAAHPREDQPLIGVEPRGIGLGERSGDRTGLGHNLTDIGGGSDRHGLVLAQGAHGDGIVWLPVTP